MIKEITTCLLVEDDSNDIFLAQRALQTSDLPVQLRVVHDGIEAREYVSGHGKYSDRQRYPLPHLILVDIKMPRSGGFEFLEWMRSPDCPRSFPAVMLSGSNLAADKARASALGVDSYLVKPLKPDDLAACLATLKETKDKSDDASPVKSA